VELLEDVDEAVVVAAFLRAELHSPRYRSTINRLLKQAEASPPIIDDPNVDDARENMLRVTILGAYRGWPDRYLFHRFPRHVRWRRATLSDAELGAVLYVNDDPRLAGRESWEKVCWFDLSRGTRLVTQGAETIRRGQVEPAYKAVFESVLATAETMRDGRPFPELILARKSAGSPLLIVEGHTRATAYALTAREQIPALVGDAEGLDRWHLA
jgi:hypothetical protein